MKKYSYYTNRIYGTANKYLHFETTIGRLWLHFRTDSLFRNSIYLMLATAVMAGFGFGFWLITARIFSTQNIGLATALISVMNIIAVLSLIGFDAAFVRFLPNSSRRNEELNTGFLLVGAAAFVLGLLFIIFAPIISPPISFIQDNLFTAIAFILFCVMSALNILTDAVFLAYRKTKYTLIINSIFSVIKMLSPFIFAPWGALGIFTAAAIAQSIGFVLSVAALAWKFEYRPALTVRKDVLRRVWKYCTGNYAAGLLSLTPVMLLPLLITNRLGPKQAAYYYIVMMLGNLLYVIPQATTRSLFAEGSFNEQALKDNLRKTIRVISWLLIPAIIVLILGGEKMLLIFGKDYSQGGGIFLIFVAITGAVVSINYTLGSLFRIFQDLKSLIIANACYATAILGLSYYLLPFGLLGIGAAWFFGNTLAALSSFILYRWDIDQKHSRRAEQMTFSARVDALVYDLPTIFYFKLRYLYALTRRRFKRQTILFYPDQPKIFHILYKICHLLGYKITNDPHKTAKAAFAFEDITVRKEYKIFSELSRNYKIININCRDISKARIEKIFTEVFGYGTFIDPQTQIGPCVKKTTNNARHDGRIIQCPVEPEAGYIYQKLINNHDEGQAIDLRIPIFNEQIPFVLLKHKSANNRFDTTTKAVMVETDTRLTTDEIRKILTFCRKLGLDYGELDILRDKDDGKLYIVDANNTPAGPRPDRHMSRKNYKLYLERLSQAFASEFLNKN